MTEIMSVSLDLPSGARSEHIPAINDYVLSADFHNPDDVTRLWDTKDLPVLWSEVCNRVYSLIANLHGKPHWLSVNAPGVEHYCSFHAGLFNLNLSFAYSVTAHPANKSSATALRTVDLRCLLAASLGGSSGQT